MTEVASTVETLRTGCYMLIGNTASNNFVKMHGSGSEYPPELTLTYTYEAPNQAFTETVTDELLASYLPKIGFGTTGYNAYCKYITIGPLRIAYGKQETYTTARHYPDAFSGLFASTPYIVGSWSSTATSIASGNFGTLKFFKVTKDGFSVAAAGSSSPTSNQPFDWIAIGEAAT